MGVLSSVITVNAALVAFVLPVGPPEIVTVGGVVSTVQARESGALWLPTASTPTTVKVCRPSASAGTCTVGGVQGVSGVPSSVQVRVPSLVDTLKSAVWVRV